MKSLLRMAISIWLLILLTGCISAGPTVIPVTPTPAPVREATRLVTQEMVREEILLKPPIEIPVTLTPRPTREPCPLIPDYRLSRLNAAGVTTDTASVDPQYYPAMLVVTQFFTYLDGGRYDEAYELVSDHLEDYGTYNYYRSKESFTNYYQHEYDKVCLYTVEPTLDTDPMQPGVQSPQGVAINYGLDENHFKLIHVVLATYSSGRESELYPSGLVRNLFLGVAKEDDGHWRIIVWSRYPG